ncbi:tetratricopeptide repeat protein [Pedobacter immunditicola]|uniref:tetratricopeptide repeat protein n=1 Tax=Pedobacter immunditicola TaxID=3133440 RepID=UPI0030B03142
MIRTLIFCLLISIYSNFTFGQTDQERILYVIDSIPVIETMGEDDELSNDEIDQLEVVTDLSRIKALGYGGKLDKIIYITTKASLLRSAEEKRIPSTKSMTKKDGMWYFNQADTPYTGKFIDYFMNGKKQGEGILVNGKVDGVRTVYYPNGQKRYYYTYKKGITNGDSEEYYMNGQLRQKGSFVEQKESGLWQVYYSTGKLKRESTFVNHKQDLPKEEAKFFNLLQKGQSLMKEGTFENAIKRFDEAVKLNSAYADLYFYRGTAKLNKFEFDNALLDFDKAIELEPLYMEAISNRAFTRLRKFQFKDGRTLSKNSQVTIMAVKGKVPIPKEDLDKICADLHRSYALGDHQAMVIDAIDNYCK